MNWQYIKKQYCGNDYDRDICMTVVLQSMLMLSKNMLVTVSNYFLSFNAILNIVLFIIIGLAYGRLVLKYGFTLDRKVVLLLVVIIDFVILSFMFRNNLFSIPMVKQAAYLFAVNAIPVLIFIPNLDSIDYLLEFFYKASYFISIIAIICMPIFIANKNVGDIVDYSMSYGQAAMVPCIFLYSHFFHRKKTIALILAIAINICIFAIGSRFPLLCIGVYVVVEIIISLNHSRIFKPLLILVPVIFILVFVYQRELSLYLYKILHSIGLRSRSLNYLLSGSMTYDSGRSEIYERVFLALKESPVIGYGFGGGYIVSRGMTHNLILDILCNVGIPFGVVIIIWYTINYIKEIIKPISSAYKELLIIFGCFFIPKALLGGELWETDKFWWILALFFFAKNKAGLNTIRRPTK